ncbi:MAG: outer membrane beta-barrel protein [Gammaproteobacteria bacterium]
MKPSAILGLLTLGSVTALASVTVQAADSVLEPRIGIAAAVGNFKGDATPSGVLGNKFIDDSSVGVKVYGQYPLNNWLAVEAAYHDTSNFKDKQKGDSLPEGELKLSFDGWSAQGLVYIPTTIEGFQAYVKGGYYNFDDELVLNGTNIGTSSERGLVFGGGMLLKVSDNLGLRADLDWFDADVGDLSSVNIGLEYFFGGAASK